MDPLQVYDKINLGRRIDPLWPDELWRSRGGQNYWKDWLPEEGMEGIVSNFKSGPLFRKFTVFYFQIVHKWSPCHREVLKRSHVDKTILLLQIGNRYVPIVETAVKMVDLEAEAAEAAAAAANESNEKEASPRASVSLPPILNESTSENGEQTDPLNATLSATGPQSLNLTSHRRTSQSSEKDQNKSNEEEFPLQPL